MKNYQGLSALSLAVLAPLCAMATPSEFTQKTFAVTKDPLAHSCNLYGAQGIHQLYQAKADIDNDGKEDILLAVVFKDKQSGKVESPELSLHIYQAAADGTYQVSAKHADEKLEANDFPSIESDTLMSVGLIPELKRHGLLFLEAGDKPEDDCQLMAIVLEDKQWKLLPVGAKGKVATHLKQMQQRFEKPLQLNPLEPGLEQLCKNPLQLVTKIFSTKGLHNLYQLQSDLDNDGKQELIVGIEFKDAQTGQLDTPEGKFDALIFTRTAEGNYILAQNAQPEVAGNPADNFARLPKNFISLEKIPELQRHGLLFLETGSKDEDDCQLMAIVLEDKQWKQLPVGEKGKVATHLKQMQQRFEKVLRLEPLETVTPQASH